MSVQDASRVVSQQQPAPVAAQPTMGRPAAEPQPQPATAQPKPVQAPAGAIEAPAVQDPQAGTPQGDLVQVWQDRCRKVQAAKDRENSERDKKIAALEYQLAQARQPSVQQPGQPAPVQPGQPHPGAIDARKFLDLINGDNPQEAINYLHGGITSEVERRAAEVAEKRVNDTLESMQRRAAFVNEFNVATAGFSEAEVDAAVGVMEEARSMGRQISPKEAAAIARFGSIENALRYAAEFARINASQAPGVTIEAPATLPAQPPRPMAPGVPGVGGGPPAAGIQSQQPVPNLQHAYRGVL